MNKISILDWIAGAILVVGGVNWGLIGLFDFNLVSTLFGEVTFLTTTVYILVGVSALYIAGSALTEPSSEAVGRVAHSRT